MAIPFFKKFSLPTFSLSLGKQKPSRVVGIDIGVSSTKVVQLRYEKERAILETYGELLNVGYLKGEGEGAASGLLRYQDSEIASLLKDALRESNVSAGHAVLSLPAGASFITTIHLPRISEKEIAEAIPFEARKYVPIPIAEVVLDWDLLTSGETGLTETQVLLVAVPRELVDKLKRVCDLAGIRLQALEVETFSLVRSLVGHERTPSAILNLGYRSSTLGIVSEAKLHASHNISHGSHELTRAMERGLGITTERAEALKREVGLSDRMEDRESTSILTPLIEVMLAEIERTLSLYNRRAPRHVQRLILSGGGASLKGLVDYASIKFGLEVSVGNPFHRVFAPAFLQPLLREIGPSFAVAIGLALREIAT